MPISLDLTGTVLVCDTCGAVERTERRDGAAPDTWMTGQLWLDVSLSRQEQRTLCFCPTCRPRVLPGLKFSLLPVQEPEPEIEEEPDPELYHDE